MEVNMYSEKDLEILLKKAIEYYLKGVQEGIDFTMKRFNECDTYQKKFNLVMQFIDDVGYNTETL